MIKTKQILCMAALLALSSGVADSSKVNAAAPRQFEELECGKTYNEDLDYDGEKEKVICKQTDVNDSNKTITVYINDNVAFKKTFDCEFIEIRLADIDGDDDAQDLFISVKDYGAVTLKNLYLQYRDSKLKLIQTMTKNTGPKYIKMSSYSFGKVSDDASFQLMANKFQNSIGGYVCIIPYELVNGKVAAIKTYMYSLSSDSKKYVYTARKKFVTYKSVDEDEQVSFRVNVGDKVKVDKIYVSPEGEYYVRIVNSKKAIGWIDASKTDLFVKIPNGVD